MVEFLESSDCCYHEGRLKQSALCPGIMNELASLVGNYFADNLTELKKLGLVYTHLRYSSQRAIPRNAEKLFQDVLDIAAKVCRVVWMLNLNAPRYT